MLNQKPILVSSLCFQTQIASDCLYLIKDTKKEMTIACDEPLLSDKDEADSDSDMCSNCSEESVPVTPPTQAKTKIVATRPAIKQYVLF